MLKIKNTIFGIIEDDVHDSLAHKIFEGFFVTLIVLNVIAVILGTYKITNIYFLIFEAFSITVFTIEFLLRIFTADIKYPNDGRIKGIKKMIFSPMGVIDILTILPFYLDLFEMFDGIDGRVMSAIRLLRLIRLFKLGRYVESVRILLVVAKSRKHELIVTGVIAILLIMISAVLIYEVEGSVQRDKFPDFLSACWWAIATLTTIGYGDVYPITGMGRLIGAIISMVGIGFIALPTGIISPGFIEEFRGKRDSTTEEKKNFCPHCGKKLD